MNEFNKHKKSDKIKWAFTGIAFLLVFVMFTGLCLQLFGTGKQKPSEWFKKPDTEQTQPEENSGVNEAASGAFISESNGNGVKLMSARIAPVMYAAKGVSAQADSAFTLTATVSPSNASFPQVDWTISPADGKVTVTPTSDGAATATVVCHEAFSVPYTITVTVRENKSLTATCTCDYVKRVVGMDDIVVKKGDSSVSLNGNINDYTLSNADFLNIKESFKSSKAVLGIGTKTETITETLTISGIAFVDGVTVASHTFNIGDISISGYENGHMLYSAYTLYFGSSFGTVKYPYLTLKNGVTWASLLNQFAGQTKDIYKITYTAQGEHSTYTKTWTIKSTFEVPVNKVSLSNSNIVF